MSVGWRYQRVKMEPPATIWSEDFHVSVLMVLQGTFVIQVAMYCFLLDVYLIKYMFC